VRIPTQKGANTRIELRSPDPSCNPYLTLALCLAAGLDGIRNQIMPPEAVDQNIRNMTEEERLAAGIQELPRSLGAALDEMEADELVIRVLGEKVSQSYIHAKRQEWKTYCGQVSEWEIENYLYRI
jgi:glutamine synthetase